MVLRLSGFVESQFQENLAFARRHGRLHHRLLESAKNAADHLEWAQHENDDIDDATNDRVARDGGWCVATRGTTCDAQDTCS